MSGCCSVVHSHVFAVPAGCTCFPCSSHPATDYLTNMSTSGSGAVVRWHSLTTPRAFCRGSLPACALGVIWLWFAFLCRLSSTQRCVPPATVRIFQKCPAREAVAVPTDRRVQYAKLPRSFGASVCSPALYALRNQFPSSLSAQSYTTHSETATRVISSAGI